MQVAGKIFRIRTNSISIGQQNWSKGTLISEERLGLLVEYFLSLGMIEQVTFVKVDQINEGHRTAA